MTEEERVAMIPSAVAEYNPGILDKIEGATEADINKLARAAKRELPEYYKAFLRWGGKRFDVNFMMTDPTIAMLRKSYDIGDWMPPEDYLLFSIAKPDEPQDDDVYLKNLDSEEPSVVAMPFPEGNSLEKIKNYITDLGKPFSAVMFAKLILDAHVRKMGYKGFLTTHSAHFILPSLRRFLRDLKFDLHPLSGGDYALMKRSDAFAVVVQSDNAPATVEIGAYTLSVLNSLISKLEREFKIYASPGYR